MKSILVTGGCGFIGSHFVRAVLGKGEWRVVNVDKLTYAGNPENVGEVQDPERYCFIKGDIAERAFIEEIFKQEKPWAVVNFAAESHVDRSVMDTSPFLTTNVVGLQVLLDAAGRNSVARFLQVSTDEVYGDASDHEPFAEGDALQPSSPYAASKAAADLLCLAYRRTHDLPVLIARSANNYGPFQFPEKLIPLCIRNALRGEPLPLYGDGLQRRDWLYVEDNVAALLQALQKGKAGSVYNIGTGQERSNLEVVQTLCRLIAQESGMDAAALLGRICFVPDRPGHDRRYALDCSRALRQLDWAPQFSFSRGLELTVRWYFANQGWMERVTAGEYPAYYDAVYRRGWGRTSR